MFEPIFQRFVDQSPATVLVCGLLERFASRGLDMGGSFRC
jgi:hypothetical protein